MARAWKKKQEDASARQMSTDGRPRTENGNGRPGLAIVTVLLCGPIALITMPVFWWLGLSLIQAALLTIFVQLALFLVVMMSRLHRREQDQHGRISSEKPDKIEMPDQKVWRSYSHDGGDVNAPRIALIAENSVQARQIATDLAQQGYDLHHTTDVDAMLETVQTRPVDWDFMIFDLDLFDDLESHVDDLMMFREDCANIPILLLSGSVSKDELSDHRRAIGDATLRKPVFRSRLLAGIAAMRTNWQTREFAYGIEQSG